VEGLANLMEASGINLASYCFSHQCIIHYSTALQLREEQLDNKTKIQFEIL